MPLKVLDCQTFLSANRRNNLISYLKKNILISSIYFFGQIFCDNVGAELVMHTPKCMFTVKY